MSMLSAQCDELRSMAESVGLEVPQAATLMMEAADTIWELRGSVHRERAEADTLRQQLADVTESMGRVEERCAKLREQNHWLKQGDILHVLTDQEYIDQCERERLMQASIDALDKDNAKLRELCETVIDDWMSKVCPTFPFCECGGEYESCADDTCGNQLYRQMLRELGEGVDW